MNRITYFGFTVPDNFRSDGCTYAKDSWFGVSIKEACRFHDFLRRYGLERRIVADMLGARAIAKLLPWWAFWVSVIYFIGMEWGSFWEWVSELRWEYRHQAFPDEWRKYLPEGHKLK